MNLEFFKRKEKRKTEKPKILALQASPRRKGFTAQLMSIVLEGIREVDGVEIEEIFLPNEHFEFCRGCFTCKSVPFHCPLKDTLGQKGEGYLHKKLEEANGLLLTAPTYFWTFSALTHNFFERCYSFHWSKELDGIPFSFVTSSYGTGMHREAAREILKQAFVLNLKLVGMLSVHALYLEDVREQVKNLGKQLAEASLKDFSCRNPITPEEKYSNFSSGFKRLPEIYLDNITEGTGNKEDLLTTQGFKKGWFRYQEAFQFFREADELFRQMIDYLQEGKDIEAMRILSKANRLWKVGTYLEFVSKNRGDVP